jgi:hypothetical protein
MKRAALPWTYSLRWALPHRPCPGPVVLASAEVPAGTPCPASVKAQWRPGCGYGIFIDFAQPDVRRWSPERKAATRQRQLTARVQRAAPLFAEELIARELAERADYYAAETIDAEPD